MRVGGALPEFIVACLLLVVAAVACAFCFYCGKRSAREDARAEQAAPPAPRVMKVLPHAAPERRVQCTFDPPSYPPHEPPVIHHAPPSPAERRVQALAQAPAPPTTLVNVPSPRPSMLRAVEPSKPPPPTKLCSCGDNSAEVPYTSRWQRPGFDPTNELIGRPPHRSHNSLPPVLPPRTSRTMLVNPLPTRPHALHSALLPPASYSGQSGIRPNGASSKDAEMHRQLFAAADTNKDGKLDRAEFARCMGMLSASHAAAYGEQPGEQPHSAVHSDGNASIRRAS